MTTPLKIARLRTICSTAVCCELMEWGCLDQLRRSSKFGASAGSGHLRRSFSTSYKCPGIGIRADASLGGQRFSGKHRLIEQNGATY